MPHIISFSKAYDKGSCGPVTVNVVEGPPHREGQGVLPSLFQGEIVNVPGIVDLRHLSFADSGETCGEGRDAGVVGWWHASWNLGIDLKVWNAGNNGLVINALELYTYRVNMRKLELTTIEGWLLWSYCGARVFGVIKLEALWKMNLIIANKIGESSF